VTRRTRVPWRDGSGALPVLPPPPAPSSTQILPPLPEPPAPAPAAPPVGALLERRPWLGKLGILVFQTAVATILSAQALLALGLVRTGWWPRRSGRRRSPACPA